MRNAPSSFYRKEHRRIHKANKALATTIPNFYSFSRRSGFHNLKDEVVCCSGVAISKSPSYFEQVLALTDKIYPNQRTSSRRKSGSPREWKGVFTHQNSSRSAPAPVRTAFGSE
ncbi:MAG TPA: hypothetical protein VKA27_15040 [Sunxiuqinia sp.]|nr:hypothetical protein [Sunxiuqinia sp.]